MSKMKNTFDEVNRRLSHRITYLVNWKTQQQKPSKMKHREKKDWGKNPE